MRPIFILTCERSGSTLLRCLLDAHPEIYSPGEIAVGPLCQALYTTLLYTKGQAQGIASESERERIVIDGIRDIIEGQLDSAAKYNNKRVWCDKSPINVEYLEMIKKVFPDAKFICLYRNCLDVVYSCISLSRMGFMSELCAYVKRHPENLVMAMIDSWMEKTRKILNFERDARFSCFRLTYESLVSSPDDTLCKLFSFLERSVDLRVINSIFSENYDFGQMSGDIKVLFSNKIYTDSIGKGSLIPRTYIPDDYMEEIANIETELGYPSLFVSNSHNIQKISSDIRNIVESDFPNRIKKNEHRLKPFVGTCKLIVTGDGGGEWFLDFGKRPWEFIQEKRDSDCSIAMSSKTLVELVEGKRNVIGVYESGHIGASGNIDMAIKIGGALFGYH